MLTVKIVRDIGKGESVEEIFECTNVQKEVNGILCQLEGDTKFYGTDGFCYVLDWEGRNHLEKLPSLHPAHAYVMNRHGATVANYRL